MSPLGNRESRMITARQAAAAWPAPLWIALLAMAPAALAQDVADSAKLDGHEVLELPARLVLQDAPLEAALTRLMESAGVRIVFSPSLLRAEQRKVTCRCQLLNVGETLQTILAGTSFGYSVIDGQIAVIATRPPASMPARPMLTGEVVEHDTGTPLAGVFVALLDREGRQVTRALTDAAGRFRFPAPGSGAYTLKADRIGYQTVHSPVVDVGPHGASYRFELQSRPVHLAGLVVEADSRQCRVRPEEGSRLQTIWDQIRAALEATAWTESAGYLSGEQLTYERWMDPVSGRVQDEAMRGRRTFGGVGFAAASAEKLVTHGFVQLHGEDYVFYGLDAATIVSDAFLDTHCFRLRSAPRGEEGWIGLAFEPARERTVPGVQGVLWIDEATAELRVLEYGYTWLPWLLPLSPFGGQTLFRRLPGGAWIVERWTIRMPQLARVPPDPTRLRPGGRDVLSRLRDEAGLLIKEEGGEVAAIFTEAGLRLPGPERAALKGVVLDGTPDRPLAGARVWLEGTEYSAWTDERGMYRMRDLPGGAFTLRLEHPALDERRMPQPARPVLLERGNVTVHNVSIPVASAESAEQPIEVEPDASLVDADAPDGTVGLHRARERIERVKLAGGGTVFDRSDIERRRPTRLTQLVGQAPGVRVTTVVHDGIGTAVIGSRRAYSGFGLCPMSVYVDGAAVVRGGPGTLETATGESPAGGDLPAIDDLVFAPDLEAVEIYHAGDRIPPEFRSRDSTCGVVLVWTQRDR